MNGLLIEIPTLDGGTIYMPERFNPIGQGNEQLNNMPCAIEVTGNLNVNNKIVEVQL